MQPKNTILYILYALLFVQCSGDSSNEDDTSTENSTTTELIFPLKNSECTEGVVSSSNNNTSTITFEWKPSKNTDTYKLTIKNLNTDSTQTLDSNTPYKDVTLDRGIPYSWYVTSINSKTSVEDQSATWKFYNAGEGKTTYPPFPADLKDPISGNTLYATNTHITFSWSASDIDNNISSYELLLDNNTPPTKSIATAITDSTYTYATPKIGTYFWAIKTIDTEGNSSTSQISQFKIEKDVTTYY